MVSLANVGVDRRVKGALFVVREPAGVEPPRLRVPLRFVVDGVDVVDHRRSLGDPAAHVLVSLDRRVRDSAKERRVDPAEGLLGAATYINTSSHSTYLLHPFEAREE